MTDRIVDFPNVSEVDEIQSLYLTFEVAEETYAVNIQHVTEIVGMQRISAMPDVPVFIKGAMNLRGKVIPVMDVRLRFGMPFREYNDRTTIVVIDLDGSFTGLVVDQVTDVLTIMPDSIEPPPRWHNASHISTNEEKKSGVILGLGKYKDPQSGKPSVVIILDIAYLLSLVEVQLEVTGEERTGDSDEKQGEDHENNR